MPHGSIGLFDRLAETGSTVVVIKHTLDVISRADWLIDMGPVPAMAEADCSLRVSQRDLAKASDSLTGRFFRKRSVRP